VEQLELLVHGELQDRMAYRARRAHWGSLALRGPVDQEVLPVPLDILVRLDSEVCREHREQQDFPEFRVQLVIRDHQEYRASQVVPDSRVRLDPRVPLGTRVMWDRRVLLELLEMLELLVL
jgi:hypothetical protein